ncbi:MAG TPA: bifunctional phosphoribosylaminoimidazolecarboxamide formyltransferase/IMP cyclohydrolase, partial [Fimbriimonadaceae bacterium]|nr:bifunctional phosphoribosylaminoimidazolecarboxamide formyltransferase/IMP cyclohydrolase [Fimbriimonadaceae bacterium]
MRRALISVTDKAGVLEFARGLSERGFDLISTGGTAAALRQGGLEVRDVSEITGFPEMLDGRVKTLHPKIHGGLLGQVNSESHRTQMAEAGIAPIDLLCVNLYQFEKTVNSPHTFEDAVESIDIGGPAMIRAAAKNHEHVLVVVDPSDYDEVLAALDSDLDVLRLRLAAKAFRHTAFYDSLIARYLTKAGGEGSYTETFTIGYRRRQALRYGENPHQSGALYLDPMEKPGLSAAVQVWGLELGYNNYNDANAAWELVADLPDGACAITKHGNPCGAAVGGSLPESFRLARDSDPISAFGGVVALNGAIDAETAAALCEKGNKLDVIVATRVDEDALDVFRNGKGWRAEVRILEAPLPPAEEFPSVRGLRGGALIQDSDEDPGFDWQVVTDLGPTAEQMESLRFLWKVIPHVKSNAIIVGSGQRLLGVGAGQMNRVQSVRLAVAGAGERVAGAVL